MFCHGELARLKPDPSHLTRFYLMISLGGALGAILVAIVAPLVLAGYFELGIALVLLGALFATRIRGTGLSRGAVMTAVVGVVVLMVLLGGADPLIVALGLSSYLNAGIALVVALAALWLLATLLNTPRGAFVGALVAVFATFALVVRSAADYTEGVRVMERDFYGVVRTADHMSPVPYRSMYHGGIMHGGQLLGDSFRDTPADYFGPTSGYGRVFASLREMAPKKPLSVGVIGLGAGVIAAWMKPGDRLVFYEISPRVVEIARREFTFLQDTAAKTEIMLGDGRLSLEREPPRGYDVLGIDAFAGDSIPMHLVTREAMAIYVKHIKPDGVIVFQATNRFVDLLPVVKRLAAEFGLEAMNVADVPEGEDDAAYWYSATDQVIVTRNRKLLGWPRIAEAAEEIADRPGLPVFTDAHHNLLRILKSP
jgi:protein-L-isoaspartate O-methyltransferase